MTGTQRVLGTALAAVAALLVTPGTAQAAPTAAKEHPAALRVHLHAGPTPEPSIGSAEPEKYPGISVTINSLHRDSSGIVSLNWTASSNGGKQFWANVPWVGDVYKYDDAPASAVTITDEDAKIRYNPLRIDPRQLCMCQTTVNIPALEQQGQSVNLFQTFKPPADVDSVTVNIPGFSPAKNIPVS